MCKNIELKQLNNQAKREESVRERESERKSESESEREKEKEGGRR